MNRSALAFAKASPFNAFLYAFIGDDKNGLPLTVLSALARRNLDPWEEASDLSRLPTETAEKKLEAVIAMTTDHSASPADSAEMAGRLIALLPHPVASRIRGSESIRLYFPVKASPAAAQLFFIAFYIAMMLLGQWVAAGLRSSNSDESVSASSRTSTPVQTFPPSTIEK